MRDLDLVVLADVNPDLVLAGASLDVAFDQVETLVEHCELTIGGSGAIMACAAARLGLRTALCGVVGDDEFGRFMRDALADRGVDVSGLVIDDTLRTGLTVVLARSGGDRAILTFPGAIGALSAVTVEQGVLARARHVHVAAWFLQRGLWPGVGKLLADVRARGASTSLDPNWDPSGDWDSGLSALLDDVDILLPNAAEARALAGGGRNAGDAADAADAGAAADAAAAGDLRDVGDVREAARALAAAGSLVVVKLGADGALACDRDGVVARVGTPPRAVSATGVVDTVGAGDTFDAGFLAGRLGGEDVAGSLALACACGALSTRAAGGTAAQPTLAEARAALG